MLGMWPGGDAQRPPQPVLVVVPKAELPEASEAALVDMKSMSEADRLRAELAASKQENARCGAPPRPRSCVSSPLAHSSLAPPPPVLRLSESPPTLCARSRLTVGCWLRDRLQRGWAAATTNCSQQTFLQRQAAAEAARLHAEVPPPARHCLPAIPSP